MARMNEKVKADLIKNAKAVYFAYWRLEVFNNTPIQVNGKETTLAQYINDLKDEESQEFTLGNRRLKLTITDDTVSIVAADGKNPDESPFTTIKGLADYSADEIADQLIQGAPFTLEQEGENVKFSTQAGHYTVGGAKKMDLYKLHISNLGRIIQHLESPTFDSNMLVSLTTGSGKTFTQALWILVLKMSDVNGVFALPSKLVTQYKEDLKRLLPDTLFADECDSQIIIDSFENILLNPNPEVENLSPENTLFSFDEAHLLAQKENLFVKAKALATRYISLYLTATPTPELQALAQGDGGRQKLKVVATMNNEQKVKNGYAQQTSSYATSAQSTTEISKGVSRMKRLGRWLADAVDPEKGFNAANAFARAYFYSISHKNNLNPEDFDADGNAYQQLRFAVRWNIQPAAFQGKTLICANHFEDIVSLDLFNKNLQDFHKQKKSDDKPSVPPLSRNYYINGNRFNRDETYSFLQIATTYKGRIQHSDSDIYDTYQNKLQRQFSAELGKDIGKLAACLPIQATPEDIDKISKEMMAGLSYAPVTNSMHNMIELGLSIIAANELSDLAGIIQNFGSIYLDQQRFLHLPQFAAKMQENASKLLKDEKFLEKLEQLLTYSASNPKGIEAEKAKELAIIISIIIKKIAQDSSENRERLCDNWYADQEIFTFLDECTKPLTQFAETNYKQFVFNHVEKNETIQPDQPFTAFVEEKHTVGLAKTEDDKDKGKEKEHEEYKAKVRAKRAVEALNPHAEEVVFSPNKEGEPSQQALEISDNMFRLGITTLYCTDKKVEGFNDPNLQQVAVIAHSDENHLANPISIIQAYGRNRGLNPLKVPNFFLVNQKGVKCLFGVDELNKADYQKDYDQATKKFKKNYIKKLGQDLGDHVLQWIDENKDPLHQVDNDKLAEEVVQSCFYILEETNQINAYQFNLTRKDFTKVLQYTIAHLQQKEKTLKQGTVLPVLVRVVAVLTYGLACLLRKAAAQRPRKELRQIIRRLNHEDNTDDNANADIAKLHYKITGLSLGQTWEHDLSRKIISMNIVSEVQKIKDLRDKYYSSFVRKPLKFITDEDREMIRKFHPDLKITLEGLFSLIALANVEEKERLLVKATGIYKKRDAQKIAEFISELTAAGMNSEHPDKDFHVARIRKMLETCKSQNIPSDDQELFAYIREDKDFSKKLALVLLSNKTGFPYLNIDKQGIKKQAEAMKDLIVQDIKILVEPLIHDPAYIKMLLFIQKNFNQQDLTIIYKGNAEVAKQLQEFIADTLNPGSDYYEKYFLPTDGLVLSPQEADGTNIPFHQISVFLDSLFKVIHESNLRFYRVTEQGRVQDPSAANEQFFTTRGEEKAEYARQAVAGYDIRLLRDEEEPKLTPQTVYIQLSGIFVVGFTQVTADGKVLKFDNENDDDFSALANDITGWNFKDGFQNNDSIKNELSPEQLKQLDSGLQTLHTEMDGKHYRGQSIFSPCLKDETSYWGRIWRQIFGLKSLQKGLPVVNRTTHVMNAKECATAKEVAARIGDIAKGKTSTCGDSLTVKLSLFSKVLQEEARVQQTPSQAMLGGKESRVEKLREKYDEKWQQYQGLTVDDAVYQRMTIILNSYITARATFTEYGAIQLKSKAFFNEELTLEKVKLACKLRKKFASLETGKNYHNILTWVEKTMQAHDALMRKYNKKPSSRTGMAKALKTIHTLLVNNIPQERHLHLNLE